MKLVVLLLLTAVVHAVSSEQLHDEEEYGEYDHLYDNPAYNDRETDTRNYNRPHSSRTYSSRNHDSRYGSHTYGSPSQGSSSYPRRTYEGPNYDSVAYENPSHSIRRPQSPGYESSSYDRRRLQSSGYDSRRLQSSSYDSSGYDSGRPQSPGYDRHRPQSPGYDSHRSQSSDYDSHRSQSPGYDRHRSQSPGYDSHRPHSSDYDSHRPQSPGYDSHRPQSPGYDSSSHDSRRYESPGYDSRRYESPGYDSRNYNNQESPEYESPDQENPDYDSSSYYDHDFEQPDHIVPETRPDYEETAYEEVIPLAADEGAVCALTCRSSDGSGTDVWMPNKEYQYLYRARVNSAALETDEDESSMAITATVIITANTICDLKMQVMDVHVEDVADEDSVWFKEAVENHDLHFSYQGGRIEHLCPHDDEDVVATNFKRGILSSLQTSLSNLADRNEVIVQESDVSGECETRYTISNQDDEEGLRMVVNKTKSSCRANAHLPYIPYTQHTSSNFNTDFPLLKNNQSCQLTLHNNVWESVECTQEISVDSPLAGSGSHASLASLTVFSSLLLQAGPYEAQDTFLRGGRRQRRESLRMDLKGALHSDEARQHQESYEVLDQIAKTMDNLFISTRGHTELEEQRPYEFSHLVSLLGQLKQEVDLDDVWNTYESKEDYREFLLDALLVCEQGPCIQLVSRLVEEDHPSLPLGRLTTWLAGLHFHTHSDPLSITYVLDVAQSKVELASQAVMAASSMVYRMCQQDSSNCLTHAQPFREYVREQIGESCGWGESRGQQELVKLMLRALGNAGVLPDQHFPEKCYLNKMLVPELRVAALQAYRRNGCVHSEAPWMILEDGGEKVDVRIAAYLALVPCATHTPGFFTRIKNLLEKEDVNQVGSFIWTHIRNLAEQPGNSEHSHQLAKLVAQHTLHDKFNTNAFRTSRNYRYAQFSELMNVGGSVESDIIFTPDSYLPRQAALNLTLDLMDKSINVFEFGGDFSGLEDYIERFFGKNGYFENEKIENIMQSLRPKRDIHQEKVEEFQRLYDEVRTKNELEPGQGEEEEAKASMYLRIFGNEVVYVDNALKSNPLQLLQQLVQDFSSPKSFQVVNQEFQSATLLGFPLRLKLNATSSVTFSRSGTFEMRNMKNILVEGKILSSLAVAMDEVLMVDGYTCFSGIRRRTTHLSHLDFGGKFTLENGQLADVQINVPTPEVATVTSSVKLSLYKNLKKDWEERGSDLPVVEEKDCSPDSLSNVLGLEICSSHSYGVHDLVPGAPYETQYTVSKADTFDHYVLSFRRLRNTVEALFNTPGSSIDRRLSFQVDLRPDGAEGHIMVPGWGIEGQYENSDSLKRISLQYLRNSQLQGEFEVSLQSVKEGRDTKFTPKFLLSLKNLVELNVDGSLVLGTDVFRAEGSIMSSLQVEPAEFTASWEREGGQHNVVAMFSLGQIFISSSGNFHKSPEKVMLQATCEYGTDPSHPHSLSLILDSSQVMEHGHRTARGYLSMQSSQAEASMDLDYKYQPGLAETNANVTLLNTQVSSQMVMKNFDEGEKKDFQVTLSFVSPQLDVNYLGQAIYKVTDHAFFAEAEVNLGSLLHCKLTGTFLQENDPFHFLSGVHFQLNDFIIQAGYNIDLSKPGQAVVLISSTVGPATGVFHLEAEYDPSQPFNVSLEAYAGYDTQQAGISFLSSSDLEWQHFSGKTKFKWFDWKYDVEHEALWSPSEKHVKVFSEERSIEATVKLSPNPLVQLLIRTNAEERDPDFQIAIRKQVETEFESYQAYLTTGSDKLFHLTATYNMDQTFSGSVRLLESLVQVYGHYSQPDSSHMEGSAQLTLTLPSQQTLTSDLSVSHSYDGTTRDVKVSYHYNENTVEGHMILEHRDGWFLDDTDTFIFSLTTPFDRLQKLGIAFESHGDPSVTDFVEIEWEDLKVRGEVQLNDPTNLEVKLLYEDGGTCDSHIHMYHKFDGQQYLTGASLGVTAAHDPWVVQVITNLDHSGMKESMDIKLNFHSPLFTVPFQLHGMSKVTESHIDLQIQAGAEEQASLTFSGNNEVEMNTRKLQVGLDLTTPWTEPVHLNITNTHSEDSFNFTIDFWSFWAPINSVTAEFNAVYAALHDIKANFYLSHDQLQVDMDFSHSTNDGSLSNHFHASANTIKVTGKFDTEWDENFAPVTSTGQLSFVNMFEHELDITLSQTRENNVFTTVLVGVWDELTYRVIHNLDLKQPLEWSSELQATLPDHGKSIDTELSFIAQPDFSSVKSAFYFGSPWTEDINIRAALQMKESQTDFDFDLLHDNVSVFKLILQSDGLIDWYNADLALEVTSSFLDRYNIHWKHNFETENLVLIEVTHGAKFASEDNHFYFRGTGNMIYSQEWYGEVMKLLHFNVIFSNPGSQIDFKVSFDSQFSGNFKVKWNDYVFSLISAVYDGLIFKVTAGIPELEYETELKFEAGNSDIPDLHFEMTKNGADVFVFANKFKSIYPTFDALFTLSVLTEENHPAKSGQLRVIADMENISDYAFNGTLRLESDFEGFEDYWAEIDTDMNIGLAYIDAHLNGLVHLNDWHYKTRLSGSLELISNFSLEYSSVYDLTYREQLLDKKEIILSFSITDKKLFQGKLTIHVGLDAPQWSMFVNFSRKEREFSGYIIPGNSKKYELSAQIIGNKLYIDTQEISADGSRFKVLQGNINWNIRRRKKQFSVNLESDIDAIKIITGQVILQQKRGLAANAKFRVNEKNFIGSVRYVSQGAKNSGRIIIKAENDVYLPFKTDANINFTYAPDKYESDLVIDLNNQKGWLSGNMKASLHESYLRFQTPYQGFENIELTVNIDIEQKWGGKVIMKTPKFCANFEGVLDIDLKSLSLSTNIQADCTEEIFSFELDYVIENTSFDVSSSCYIQGMGLLYKFETSGMADSRSVNLKIEGQVYPQYTMGVLYSGEFSRDETSLSLRVYDLYDDITHFLYKFAVLKKSVEVILELNQNQLLTLEADYDLQPQEAKISSTYSHSLFGSQLNIKLSMEVTMNEDEGNMEMLLTTDAAFDHADLFIEYDFKEEKQGNFKLSTTLGDAEGKFVLQETDNLLSVTADMISSLHSYQEYYFKFDHEHEGDNHHFKVISVQDEIEFQLKVSSVVEDDKSLISLNLLTPFQEYENFDIGISYPETNAGETAYSAHIHARLDENLYGINVNHDHQESWNNQKTALTFISPTVRFGNASVSFMYDIDGQAAVQFDTSRGSLGFESSWQYLKTDIIINMTLDLTFFDLGKYIFKADIPLLLSQNGEIRLERRQTDLEFIGHIITGANLRHANVSLILVRLKSSVENTSYMLSYDLDRSLKIEGQFEAWQAMAVIEFGKNNIPGLSGSFKATTNIEGYEAVDGMWDIGRRGKVYFTQINIDMRQKGTVALSVTLDTRPKGAPEPWESVKMSVLFESPFTLTHHIQAEYQLSAFSIAGSYQYGLDTFHINFNSKFKRKVGTVSLTGNIPVRGISTFNLDLNYRVKETFIISMTASVEETTLEADSELALDGTIGSVTLSMSSPFILPIKATLSWSFTESPVYIELSCNYGKHTGEVKITLEDTNDSKQLKLVMKTPFEMLSVFDFGVQYTLSDSNHLHGSADLSINHHTFKTAFNFINSNSEIKMELSGSFKAFNHEGSFEMVFGKINEVYEGEIMGKMTGYKPFHFILTFDKQHIQSSVKYDGVNVLNVHLNFTQISIKFAWKQHTYFSLTAHLTPTDDGYQFELALNSSMTKPLTAHVTFSNSDGYEGNARVTLGDVVYNMSATVRIRKRLSNLEFRLDSSENPGTPIVVKARYDLKNFLKGRMNSMMDIASGSFEWGEIIQLKVTGMRNRNRAKVIVEITTPFKSLPQLQIGYDGEFSSKQSNVNFTYTAFVDWSQRVTVTGFFKMKNGNVNLQWALSTPFRKLEKLSLSLKFNSHHIEGIFVYNRDEWSILCDYELSSTFSLTLTAKTPISGFNTITFVTSAGLQGDVINAHAELTWQEARTVSIQVQAEMWGLEIQLKTPWKPLQEASFITSLKTESEELMYTAALEWDERNAIVTLIYSPERFQFLGKYEKGGDKIGLARAEYTFSSQEYKYEMEVLTPFESFKSLEAALHLGIRDHLFKIKSNINDITNLIEGLFSVTGGKFTVDIPMASNFKWTLEASNMWMDMDTLVSFLYPRATVPLTTFVNYRIYPNDKRASLSIEFASPDFSLESLSFNMTASYWENLKSFEASSYLLYKMRNKEPLQYGVHMTSSVSENQVSSTFDFDSNQLNIPYILKCQFPLYNMFLDEGTAEIVLYEEEEQLYKLSYVTVFSEEHSTTHHLALEFPEWAADIQIVFTEESVNFSFSYPEPTTKHTLLLTWSEDFSLEKFTVGAELNSPYLNKATFYLSFKTQKLFTFSLESGVSYGTKKIDVTGIFQYVKKLRKVLCDLQVTSDWIGKHSLEGNIQWLRNISADIMLHSLDKEHTLKLLIDVSAYTVQLTCYSSWLPYENLILTGTINNDFEPSNIQFEGQLTGNTGANEIFTNAVLMSKGFKNTTFTISATQNKINVFSVSGLTKSDDTELKIVATVKSFIPGFESSFSLQYIDSDEERHIILEASNELLFKRTYLEIFNGKYWRKLQQITMKYGNYDFKVATELGDERAEIRFHAVSDYFYYTLRTVYHPSEYNIYSLKLGTSMDALQELIIRTYWPVTGDGHLFRLYFRGNNYEETSLNVDYVPDPVMGRSISVSLTTPFKGYEKLGFITPQFNHNNNIFTVMLEYPGGKTGIILRSESLYSLNSDMQFSIYLPFEKYEIISLQCVRGHAFEIRVGKVGITLSLTEKTRGSGVFQIQSLIRINEYSMKASLFLLEQRPKTFRAKLQFDFYPKDLLGFDFFLAEFQYNPLERLYFVARTNQEELMKAHVAWGSDKVFAITTPKRYPGYLILNLESTKELNDYHVQVGVTLKEDGTWENYSFHIHQEILEAGRHLSLSGETLEHQFYVDGTLSVNSFHFNESLVFELNNNKIGYRSLFKREPGFFNSIYTGDIYVLLPAQTLHYKTNATVSSSELEILSSYTWNEQDSELQPVTLKLNYNDASLFGQVRHYLKVVFSHPDIEDVYLNCYIHQAQNSPLHGSAKLIDENSPDRNIVMMFDIQPVTDDGEHSMKINISQPFSGFALSMDAHIMESVFTRGDYTFKYWSLTKEMWEDLKVMTAVDTTESGYDFSANIFTSQATWGYSYKGDIHSWDNSATFNIQGNSEEFGDFWKFGTSINKHLPSLLVYLDIGQKDQEAYEEGRVRIGLHNPVELGAVLDHKRFGEWSNDGTVGMKLIAPDILQFIFEFDPALDYSDSSILHHLTSPGDRVLNAWWRDLISMTYAVMQWVSVEATTAMDVLTNHQTLQTVLDSETDKYNHFISQYQILLSSISEDIMTIWNESLQPALVAAWSFTSSVFGELDWYLQYFTIYMNQELGWMIDWLEEAWESVDSHFSSLGNQFIIWWNDWTIRVVTAFNDMMYQVVRSMNLTRSAIQEYWLSVKEALQPYLQQVNQVFVRYAQELEAVFGGQCWYRVKQMVDEVTALTLESVDGSVIVMREFLQTREYYNRVLQLLENMRAWWTDASTIIQDGFYGLHEAILDSSMYQALQVALEQIGGVLSEISFTRVYDFMEHGVPGLGLYATTAVEEILTFWGENTEALKRFTSENIFFNYINVAAGNVYDRVLLVWQSWREDQRHNLETFERGLLALADASKNLLNEGSFFTEESVVFEPVVFGKVIYNQYLPVPWTSFLEAPQWYRLTNMFQKESAVIEAQRIIAEGMDDITSGWEALHFPRPFIPPFTATATIVGQHITTFDLHHYQFLGPCSYLLMRDFVGGDFTVIGVYKSEAGVVGLESVEVQTPSKNVTLHMDGTVTTTDERPETYTSGSHIGVKIGGLLVSCNQESQGCSFTVSGKYFGRLAGLMGNYNYEPSDDYSAPDGSHIHNAADMATKWAVSSKPCYQANQATQLEDISAAEGVDDCVDIFLHGDSPLSSCFYLVDPQPYFWHCVNNYNRPQFGDEMEIGACKAVAAYRTQCLTHGVHLPSADQCVTDSQKVAVTVLPPTSTGTCSMADETVPNGWSHIYQGETDGSADIAFIVELANCNKDKNLQLLIKLLKVQLRKTGIQDVRYALVTVQGDTVEPPSAFMNDEDMSTLLGTLVLEGPKAEHGGAEAVISTARNLRWRPGVSRTIIQMSCRACNEGDAVLQALQSNDITLHIITKFKVIMSGPNKKKSATMAGKLIGFDEEFVFTARDIKKFTGNVKLRAALQEPESSCVRAAQVSGGSVFSTNKWITKKEEAAKKFLRVLNQRIAVSSSAPECQECRCNTGTTESAITCRKCSDSSGFEDVVVPEVSPSQVEEMEQEIAKKNLTIKSDIKRDFVEQFIDGNEAFALVRNADGDESDSEEGSQSDESDENDFSRNYRERVQEGEYDERNYDYYYENGVGNYDDES